MRRGRTIFDAGLIDHTFANRTGKGTHRAIEVYEHHRNRHAYALRCDIYRYFPAISTTRYSQAALPRIACRRTLALLDMIVDGSDAQEPVNLYFGGDDLFAPYERPGIADWKPDEPVFR